MTLRYWTAGESHGKTLLACRWLSGRRDDRYRPDRRRTAAAPRRLWPRRHGSGSRPIRSKSSAASGTTRRSAARSRLQVVNKDYKLERLDDLARPRPGHGDLTGAIKYLGSDSRRSGTGQRSRDDRPRRGRRAGQAIARAVRHHGVRLRRRTRRHQASSPELARWPSSERCATPSEIYSLEPAHDDEVKQLIDATRQRRRHAGRHRRSPRRRPAVRPGHARPMGPQARRPAGPGRDGRAGDQGRRDRPGLRGGAPAAARRCTIRSSSTRAKRDTPNLGYVRPTNNAGGLEAGMTNGQPLVVRAAKKPISTLRKPLESINLETKQPEAASYERSDVCRLGRQRDRGKRRGLRSRRGAGRQIRRRQPDGNEGAV